MLSGRDHFTQIEGFCDAQEEIVRQMNDATQ